MPFMRAYANKKLDNVVIREPVKLKNPEGAPCYDHELGETYTRRGSVQVGRARKNADFVPSQLKTHPKTLKFTHVIISKTFACLQFWA